MRKSLDRSALRRLFKALGRSAPRRGTYRVYLTGGTTAVERGWRPSTMDADLSADRDEVFADVQGIKERLDLNIEFAKPTDFVPALPGEADRHVFIRTEGPVHFYHFDPYSQALSKIVRDFERDREDVRRMVGTGWVDPAALLRMVRELPEVDFRKYPQLSKPGVVRVVKAFAEDSLA